MLCLIYDGQYAFPALRLGKYYLYGHTMLRTRGFFIDLGGKDYKDRPAANGGQVFRFILSCDFGRFGINIAYRHTNLLDLHFNLPRWQWLTNLTHKLFSPRRGNQDWVMPGYIN